MVQTGQLHRLGFGRALGVCAALPVFSAFVDATEVHADYQDLDPVEVIPSELEFDSDSRVREIDVFNNTDEPIAIVTAVDPTSSDPGAFVVDPSDCADGAMPHDSCTIHVTFIADSPGSYVAGTHVAYSGPSAEGNITIGMLGRIDSAPSTTLPSTTSTISVTTTIPSPPTTTQAVVTSPPTSPGSTPTSTSLATTPPSVPSSTTAPTADEELAACDERARATKVGLPTTQTMTLGESSELTLQATVDPTFPDATSPDPAPPTTVETVSLRCEVWARLTGLAFEISPVDFQQRSFLDSSTVEWTWTVKPVEAGDQTLLLTLQGRVPNGLPGQTIEERFSIAVVVDEPPWWRSLAAGIGDVARHPIKNAAGVAALVTLLVGAWRGITGRWPWKPTRSGSTPPTNHDPDEIID